MMQILIEATLKTTLLLLACWAVTKIARRASAAWKHALWTAALGGAILLLPLAVLMPAWRVVPQPMVVTPQLARSNETAKPEITPRVTTPTTATNTPSTTPATSAVPFRVEEQAIPSNPMPSQPPQPSIAPARAALIVWLIGMAIVVLRYSFASWRVRCLVATSGEVDDAGWLAALRIARQQLDLQTPVLLLRNAALDVPIAWGALRPRVVLPEAAGEWSAERRLTVLMHELAHVKRSDALTQIVGQMATVVYWFHPLVWTAAATARNLRERACDDHVLHQGAAPSQYAQELLAIVGQLRPQEKYSAALAMARRSQIEGRLLAILDPAVRRRSLSKLAVGRVLLLGCAIVLPSAALKWKDVEVAHAAQTDAAATVAPPAASAQSVAPQAEVHEPASSSEAPEARRDEAERAMSAARAEASASAQGGSSTPAALPSDSPLLKQLAACNAKDETISTSSSHSHQSSNMNIIDDSGKRSWIVKWSRGECSINLDSEGTVKFNDEFTAVQSISPGGFVDMTMRVGNETQRVRFEPQGSGVRTQYWKNGTEMPMDANAWAAVRDLAIMLDRQTAFAIDYRFPKLLKEGGPSRVLQEVDAMLGDYARSLYLQRLVQQVDLKPQDLDRAIDATLKVSSDYETARVLMAVAAKYDLNQASTRAAYLRALDKLKSDYEHARTLLVFFGKAQIPAELARTVLQSAAKLKSDYELARVLIDMAGRKLVTKETEADYVATIGRLQSDYEHARTLINYLGVYGSDQQRLGPVVEQVAHIKSDYEAARVLMTVAQFKPEGQLRDQYVRIANGISSEYERKRALEAIGYRPASY